MTKHASAAWPHSMVCISPIKDSNWKGEISAGLKFLAQSNLFLPMGNKYLQAVDEVYGTKLLDVRSGFQVSYRFDTNSQLFKNTRMLTVIIEHLLADLWLFAVRQHHRSIKVIIPRPDLSALIPL